MRNQLYQSCIEACMRCAQECEYCGDACLHEMNVGAMADCIRLTKDCAEVCWMAAGMMRRGSRFAGAFCGLCAEVCEACGNECARHPQEHCQRCAEACMHCAEECRRMAAGSLVGAAA